MCWHQTNNHAKEYYWGRWESLWLDIPCWSGGGRTLLRGVRPFLRSKELTERWVCPFSRCEWRDHLDSSTLPVASPGSRGGRWLTPLSFFTPAHPKTQSSSSPPPPARFLRSLALTPTAARRPLTMIPEFFLRSDSAMLCRLLRQAATLFFWVEVDLPGYGEAFIESRQQQQQQQKSAPRKTKQIYNATEETRSAETRSRYGQATAMCVKRMFVSKTAALRFGLHNSLYRGCISVSNYSVSDCLLSLSVTWETS